MNWGLPPLASTFEEVDQLFYLILIISGVAFVLTEGALLYFVLKYRARDGRRAAYTHGDKRLELAWTIVPGVILFGLAVYQYGPWLRLKVDLPAPEQAVQVRLAPEQFVWKVTYPGADRQLDTPDDIQAPDNVMHVPVNEPVLITLASQDVIHSFFVPAFRVKQDALPGTVTEAWFTATETGEYEFVCAELCGLGHYTMGGRITVETREEFEAWLAERQAATDAGTIVAQTDQ